MKIFRLGAHPIAVRCPNIDIRGAQGFTVFAGGPVGRLLRPLRMQCLIADVLLLSTERRLGVIRSEAGRVEALAICVPQLIAHQCQADRL